MNDFDKIKKEMLNKENSKKVEKLAGSEEAKRISQMINVDDLKKAATSGNKDMLQSILGKVLASEDGKKLVEKIGENFGKNP